MSNAQSSSDSSKVKVNARALEMPSSGKLQVAVADGYDQLVVYTCQWELNGFSRTGVPEECMYLYKKNEGQFDSAARRSPVYCSRPHRESRQPERRRANAHRPKDCSPSDDRARWGRPSPRTQLSLRVRRACVAGHHLRATS